MTSAQEPVFDFMVVRAPESPSATTLARHYIQDEAFVAVGADDSAPVIRCRAEDLHSDKSQSVVGRLVFGKVFCDPAGEDDPAELRTQELIDSLLNLLPHYFPCVESPDEDTEGTHATSSRADNRLPLDDLARLTVVAHKNWHVLLPDRLDSLPQDNPLIEGLMRALSVISEEQKATPWKAGRLRERLAAVFGVRCDALHTLVFTADGAHTADYRKARRTLFDALCFLYVVRRRHLVNLEAIIDGLRVLHLLHLLAVDALLARARANKKVTPGERALLEALCTFHPQLQGWDLAAPVRGFPLFGSAADLRECMRASPVVHPVFARLFWYVKPFNDIKPIGVGDLKVVRQWLTAYLPGEISHIHNVMKGETKTNDHRRLEKSDQTFSFSDTSSEESTRDVQTTQRFEVKNEAEQVVKSALGVTANASVSYKSDMVLATVGAGFSYNRTADDTTRTAQNFAREVMDKAVQRVTSQTVSQRSSALHLETEEKNLHTFTNDKANATHVSGIYRWVDKQYTAQVFNYGKRLMFEFLVPEPAAFWAASRLRAVADTLDVPQPPWPKPVEKEVDLGFTWQEVPSRYAALSIRYDLRHLPRPELLRKMVLRDAETRMSVFTANSFEEPLNYSKVYSCHIDGAKGYQVATAELTANYNFEGRDKDKKRNGLAVQLDQRLVWERYDEPMIYTEHHTVQPIEPVLPTSDEVALQLRFSGKLEYYSVSLGIELVPTTKTMEDWQHNVYETVREAEQRKLDKRYEQEAARYEAELSEYRQKIEELKALTVHDVLQGRASAVNKAVMDEEIKKHCLTLITKEFDTDDTDDLLQGDDPLTGRTTKIDRTLFKVHRKADHSPPTTAGFEASSEEEQSYPSISIDAARKRGIHVQFLEQAFEWHHLSYLFYPYFWAKLPRWVELMNRSDDTDPNFTAFLRAGMARVLVAVTPAYEDAVLHYLATRQPWAGGPAPVIGDPLFLPLHEELRKQSDDRLGGEPDGAPWTFVVPTSLVKLHGGPDTLPDIKAERAALDKQPGEA
ncbi:hypothetical protein O1Q96_01015 (plasmid) [Streptomyces sp. Qhu-G9]|uniref:hypothetical protein n=1 Tax=Streptomyces sp. Qhu-G9 TaxID=3452799 RepID=UPI0022AC3765|nr:hypothetical protein [Streptomyces aurantiacus]WAU78450.1 hypothetical protein O1Q96_01015 [Streptomyces aurantiacus]